jgi:hypothetical protein
MTTTVFATPVAQTKSAQQFDTLIQKCVRKFDLGNKKASTLLQRTPKDDLLCLRARTRESVAYGCHYFSKSDLAELTQFLSETPDDLLSSCGWIITSDVRDELEEMPED